jgi:hypothetical protein
MGYYTKLKLSCQLDSRAPFDVLEKLCSDTMYEFITGQEHPAISSVQDTPNLPIDHPFGKTHRWTQIFGSSTCTLNTKRKTLKIECDIKAYEGDYEKLIDWLKPYIISGTAKYKGEDMDHWIKIL